jgi:hypothetical protein
MAIKESIQLKQIALSIRNAASALAPRKKGRLRNELRRYNTPERMIKTLPNGNVKIDFFVAPPGAVYGKYWNSPYGSGTGTTATIKKRYPQHFDYGEKGYQDPSVRDAIEVWKKQFTKEITEELRETIRFELGTDKRK